VNDAMGGLGFGFGEDVRLGLLGLLIARCGLEEIHHEGVK
jgi:hypothetical protein